MNRDKYGIIGQDKGSNFHVDVGGGDAAAWHGHWVYLNDGVDPTAPDHGKVKDAHDYVNFFQVSSGAYVRHPIPEQTKYGFGAYYSNPWSGCLSRDQMTGVLAVLIKGKKYKEMFKVILHHSLKGFLFSYNTIHNNCDPEKTKFNLKKFFYNPEGENYYKPPDVTGPDILAMELRGFGLLSWIFWPLLCILDLHTLANAYFHNKKDTHHVISFSLKYLVSREHVPTPTSWLAAKILDEDEIIKELREYWCGSRDNCEFVPLYSKKLKKVAR